MRTDAYHLGSSYYPEQWAEHRWEDDFRKMRELGFNVVRMGEFAWASFEPAPGRFDFDWMDRAVDLAARHGIAAILCTPTASVPPWLRRDHRDCLGGNEKGPFDYGARKGYCTSSPAMIEASDRITTALAGRFGDNPNVIGWQLDNEPGYPFACFDPCCLAAFRRWLADRYGVIARLNEAWGTAFWSHIYDDWDEIEFPVNTGDGAWNPGQRLDYRRFFSASFSRYLERQASILRPRIGDRFIMTNWPNACWSVDVFKAAAFLDASAWDNYTPVPGVTDPREQYFAGLNHDICRAAGPNQRFLVTEQSVRVPAHALADGVRLQTYIDLAHGAAGTIFFEWRPPVGGAEQGYESVLAMDGSFGPAGEPLARLGRELARLGPVLAGATTDSDVAMIFSYENQWNQGFWNRGPEPEGYDAEFDRWYRGLKSLGRNIDVVPPEADLSRYRLVAAPGLRIVSDEAAARLRQYVEAGGVLVLNVQAGTRDPTNRLRELIAPGVFAEIAGLVVTASIPHEALARRAADKFDKAPTFDICFDPGRPGFPPLTVMEGIELKGAEAIATFRGGRMTGRPAVTVHAADRGHVVYVGADSHATEFYERLAGTLAARFHIGPIVAVPHGIEVVSRAKGDREFIFLLNLTETAVAVPVEAGAHELIDDVFAGAEVRVPALGVRILQRRRPLRP